MPQKKEEVIIKNSDPGVIIVKGKKYRLAKEKIHILDHHQHLDKLVFEPINEKDYNKDIEFIVAKINKVVDKEKLLKEIIKTLPLSEVKKVKKLLLAKQRIKMTPGCYSLTIGGKGGACIQLA